MADKGVQSELDFKLCLICQKETDERLIENPVSHEKLLKSIEERIQYGDSQYSVIWNQLRDATPQQLAGNTASWHRSCYQEATHAGKLKRAKARYDREGGGSCTSSKRKKEEKKFTRSQTSPYNKELCFFCEQGAGYRDSLHSVSTASAGQSIRAAVQVLGDARLLTKLSTAIDANDAHAIDIKYHKNCYLNKVTNVLRHLESNSDQDSGELAAKVEFLDITKMALREGKPLNMAELEVMYGSVLRENDVVDPSCSRKALKQLISSEIPEVEFHRPKRMNEPERVTSKEIRDESILLEEAFSKDIGMKTIYDAAAMLRKCINKCKKWVFKGRFDDIDDTNLPKELYCFFRWVVQGPKAFTSGRYKLS